MIPAKGVPAKGISTGKDRKPVEVVEPKKPKAKKAKE